MIFNCCPSVRVLLRFMPPQCIVLFTVAIVIDKNIQMETFTPLLSPLAKHINNTRLTRDTWIECCMRKAFQLGQEN